MKGKREERGIKGEKGRGKEARDDCIIFYVNTLKHQRK